MKFKKKLGKYNLKQVKTQEWYSLTTFIGIKKVSSRQFILLEKGCL